MLTIVENKFDYYQRTSAVEDRIGSIHSLYNPFASKIIGLEDVRGTK